MQPKPKTPEQAEKPFDFQKGYEAAMQALLAEQRENQGLRDTLAMVQKDMQFVEEARLASQDLLAACLSTDPDSKHNPQANAVRGAMMRGLERNGWLAPMPARELKRELDMAKRELRVAKRRLELCEAFGVKPSDVVVADDGSAAAVPVAFDGHWAIAGGEKPTKKPASKKPSKK